MIDIRAMKKLRQASQEWATGDKDLFYEQAILRAEKLLETLVIPLSNLDGYKHARVYEIPRIFTQVELIGPNGHTPTKAEECAILMKAHPYAQAWYHAIQSFIHGCINMVTSLEINSNPRDNKGSLIPQEFQGIFGKIRFKGSVAVLAALLRLLAERCLLDDHNKSSLCRHIANTFSTKKQTDISWKSLKNHFDTPSESSLRFWDTEISHWHHLSRKLISLN